MQNITYIGEQVSDSATFKLLPMGLQAFLLQNNGLIAYYGGIHFRGCCQEPGWHSLKAAWHGPKAFWRTYPKVKQTDIPFAQDGLGNQFLLRKGDVWFLDTETGQMHNLQVDFLNFLTGVQRFPNQALDLAAVAVYEREGGLLQPGELLAIYPPACIKTTGDEENRTLTPMPVEVRLDSLADLYKQISRLRDGQQIRLRKGE